MGQLAKDILEIIPLVMRTLAAALRDTRPSIPPAHLRTLSMLAHRSWNLTQLAEHQGVSPATLSRSISTLMERGWVDRSRDPEDRRRVCLGLTTEGSRVLGEVQRRAESVLESRLEVLSEHDREALRQSLEVLRSALIPPELESHEDME